MRFPLQSIKPAFFLICSLAVVFPCLSAFGAERYSNGIGGGLWSDTGSWRDDILPASNDHVVIATGDTIIFDLHTTGAVVCASLFIDPQACLDFMTADNIEHSLNVAGPIESYGRIRLDAARAPQARISLNLVAHETTNRFIRLLRNSSMIVAGTAGADADNRNTSLSSIMALDSAASGPGSIFSGAETILELNGALVSNIHVSAYGMDNTGFKPNERLNITDNHFTGHSRLTITSSDTPVVRRNLFDGSAGGANEQPAISITGCKLAQIDANIITGAYAAGIALRNDIESSLTANTVTIAGRGIYVHGRSTMLRNNVLGDCNPCMFFDNAADATLEHISCAGSGIIITALKSTLQAANFIFTGQPHTNTLIKLNGSSISLLNAPMHPDQVDCDATSAVTAMDYFVARVTGKLPAGCLVELRTAPAGGGPPKGKSDLNVRNSPAKISTSGLTPLPASGLALVLKSWTLSPEKTAPPFYELRVMQPPEKPGAEQRTLKSIVLEPKPDWYRPNASLTAPTIEVSIP